MSWKLLPMVPNVERVSMELLLLRLLLQLVSNRSPRERIFLQNQIPAVGFLRNFGSFQIQKWSRKKVASYYFEIQKSVSKSSLAVTQAYLLVPGYKNLSSRRRDIQILVGLGRTVEKIKIWNLVRVWWIRNPSVQLCRVYRKPKIWSPGWKLIPKKISQLIPNACYVQFQARPADELSISKGFWIFFVKSLSRKIIPWTFVKFRCYYLSTYYLEVLEMCRESLSCVRNYGWKIQISRCWLPPVAAAYTSKNSNSKIAHKISKKSAKLLLQSSISPVGLVLCHLEIVFPQLSSSSQLSTKFVYYKIFSWV